MSETTRFTTLTDAEYEPIRSALFDMPPGQGAEAAKRRIAENLVAAGYRIVKDQPDHFVTFLEDRWFIEHSLDCRIAGTIGTCVYHEAIMKVTDDDIDTDDLGRWRITEVDTEGLPALEIAG